MEIFIAIVISFFLGLTTISLLDSTVKSFAAFKTVTALISLAFSVMAFMGAVYPWVYWVSF